MTEPTMTDNPFAAPVTDEPAVGLVSGSLADLRTIATRQKGLLVCILAYLLGFIALLFGGDSPIGPALGLVVLVALLAGAIYTALLAMKVYGSALGILLTFFCLVPLLGLLILLMVNQKATGVLKQNGVSVGMLGADMATLPTA